LKSATSVLTPLIFRLISLISYSTPFDNLDLVCYKLEDLDISSISN